MKACSFHDIKIKKDFEIVRKSKNASTPTSSHDDRSKKISFVRQLELSGAVCRKKPSV